MARKYESLDRMGKPEIHIFKADTFLATDRQKRSSEIEPELSARLGAIEVRQRKSRMRTHRSVTSHPNPANASFSKRSAPKRLWCPDRRSGWFSDPRHAGDKPLRDRVGNLRENDRNRLSFPAQRAQGCSSRCNENIRSKRNEFLCERRVSIKLKAGPSVLNANRFTRNPSNSAKSCLKRSIIRLCLLAGGTVGIKYANERHVFS